MDQFQTIQSGKGLLKDQYDDSPVSIALKRRAARLKEKTEIPTKDEVEINKGQG